MTEPTKLPTSRRVMLGIASACGAIALALVTGLASGLGERVSQAVPVANLPPAAQSEPAGPAGKDEAKPDSVPASPPHTVRLRVPISASAVGVAQSEAAACTEAVAKLTEQVNRQCDKIVLESKAASQRIELEERSCRSCGAVSGEWRCVADSAATCIVLGE
jgi:hypothetical protein